MIVMNWLSKIWQTYTWKEYHGNYEKKSVGLLFSFSFFFSNLLVTLIKANGHEVAGNVEFLQKKRNISTLLYCQRCNETVWYWVFVDLLKGETT